MSTKNEEVRFRGSWSPRIPTAAVDAGAGKVLLKLECGPSIRLSEVEEPLSLDKVTEKFGELFDAKDVALTYFLPGDPDEISIRSDGDLALAQRFGGELLKIIGTPRAPCPEFPAELDDVFAYAEWSLARQGVEAPADQIKLLLEILDLKPRRLVKYGLAPVDALKKKEPTRDDDKDEDAWEPVAEPISEPIAKLSLEAEATEAMPIEVDEDEDVVVGALRALGITMSDTVIHTLLRILDVPPNRFVKLKLVKTVQDARKAYKDGGATAAKELKCGAGHKKWGRGLCGGRGAGRGAGWAFEQYIFNKKARHHHHRPGHHHPGHQHPGHHHPGHHHPGHHHPGHHHPPPPPPFGFPPHGHPPPAHFGPPPF